MKRRGNRIQKVVICMQIHTSFSSCDAAVQIVVIGVQKHTKPIKT
jgi:hypothetical protein